MTEPLEPLPADIVEKLATLVPPPMPEGLPAALLPGIHAAASAGATAALPWWLARVPAWVPIATLVVGAAGGAGVALMVMRRAPAPAPIHVTTTVAPAAPPPEAKVEPAPPAQPPKPRPPPPKPPAPAVDHLREERVLIEAARAAVARHPEDGLTALQQHEREFPHGQLEEEREALAVQLLLRLGRVDEARARYAGLARAFPHSALLGVLDAGFPSGR